MTKDYDLIRKCLLQIEEKLDWGSAASWHNEVFIELSKLIHDETNVLLSPTTLKRVWGKVNYDSNPSINTLNTLAQFAGHLNWRDFKNNTESKPKKKEVASFVFPKMKLLGAAMLLAILVAFILAAMKTNENTTKNHDFANVTFSSRPIASGLPNSVVFDFDLQNIESDSIYIQQYWDKTKTIKLRNDQSQATGQYYYPGYFRAKLLVNGHIGKEHDLFIKSEGWLGTIDYDPIPKYIDESLVLKDHLRLPENALNEIMLHEKPLVSSFHYVDDFGDISGDNFSLAMSMRNIYSDKWAICSTTRVVILGTTGAMIIPFSIPGCVSEIGLMMNDVYLSGKENDLSMFGTDLSQFQNFEIKVEGKAINVIIEVESIYRGKYNESIGKLVGLRFRFLGAGEVKDIKLEKLGSENSIFDDEYKIRTAL